MSYVNEKYLDEYLDGDKYCNSCEWTGYCNSLEQKACRYKTVSKTLHFQLYQLKRSLQDLFWKVWK